MTARIGCIGAGGIATRHLGNLEDNAAADVVAICDIDEETARDAAASHDAAVYTDDERMFESEDIDAVIVAVPPFAHEGQEQLAVEHGVDLFVEKPLGLERAGPREIEAAIEDAGVLSQVGHMNRYHPVVERAQSLIGDRTIAYIDGHWICGVPGVAWWRQRDRSGGQVVEQATHTFDLVRYFGGDVETVRAAGSQLVRTEEIDFPDATSATLTHESGMVSHVGASSASPSFENSLTLVGEGFHLDIDLDAETLSGEVDGETIDYTAEADAWGREIDAFVEAVDAGDGDLLRSPYADARQTFETTLAVNEAIDSGDSVDVEVA